MVRPKDSMKMILKKEIVRRINLLCVDSEVRRSQLRRDILKDPKVSKDLVNRLTREGSKKLSVDSILRRIDRVFADALDSVEGVDLRYDRKMHCTWVVKIDEEVR